VFIVVVVCVSPAKEKENTIDTGAAKRTVTSIIIFIFFSSFIIDDGGGLSTINVLQLSKTIKDFINYLRFLAKSKQNFV
jgi:hypothetical protein